MENYIGIDISLNSTAIYIESDKGRNIISFTNKKDNNIYIKELRSYGVIFYFLNKEKSENYSEHEIIKLKEFKKLSTTIVDEIVKYIDINKKTYCNVEGYSYSKNTSSLIDIIGFSTLIRSKLLDKIPNINIDIVSPSTLKLNACKISYKPVDIGKRKPKIKYMNNEGISGGSFKKPEMFKAILEGEIDNPIYNMLIDYKYLKDRKNIPNPIEDIIDAIFACKIIYTEIKI